MAAARHRPLRADELLPSRRPDRAALPAGPSPARGTSPSIGLGAGGLACYAPAGSRWTFLEIDPLVERIARDPALFTFLALSPGAPRVVIGDGRIRLRELAAGTLDTVVVDAFSSDAVPVHLLTREFVALALERVRPDGRVVFHISNRYLDLGPVLASAAASLGAEAFEQAHAASHPDAVLVALAGGGRGRRPWRTWRPMRGGGPRRPTGGCGPTTSATSSTSSPGTRARRCRSRALSRVRPLGRRAGHGTCDGDGRRTRPSLRLAVYLAAKQ